MRFHGRSNSNRLTIRGFLRRWYWTHYSPATAPDLPITRNAVRALPPGHGSGTAIVAGNDTLYEYAANFVNLSGATITSAKICAMGWYMSSSGTAACGNNVAITGYIEYPVGGTQYPTSFTITNDATVLSPEIVPGAGIPAGATFKVSLSSTVPTGQNRLTNNGFAGVTTTGKRALLKPVSAAFIGDSIMTASSTYVGYSAANGLCPCIQMSIAGTKAQSYAPPSTWAKFVDLFQKLGVTHVVSNYATNDFGGSRTLAQVQGDLGYMRDQVRAVGIKFVQTTNTPQSRRITYTLSAGQLTSTGTVASAVVPNSSLFEVGGWITVSGAAQTEYNGTFPVVGIPDATTIQYAFDGSATSPATGTIIVGPYHWSSTKLQQNATLAAYAPGGASDRGQLNAWIRGGAFDDYIEWADPLETGRDTGRWRTWKEWSYYFIRPEIAQVVAGSPFVADRFPTTWTGPDNSLQGGFTRMTTGANAGLGRGGNNNTGPNIIVSPGYPNVPAIGDEIYLGSNCMKGTSDGLHPDSAAGGKCGVNAQIDATVAKLNTWLGISNTAPTFSVQPTLDASSYTAGDTVTLTVGTAGPKTWLEIDEFSLNGVDKRSEIVVGLTTVTWDSTGESAGPIVLRVRATNVAGTVLSNSVSATLNEPVVGSVFEPDVFEAGVFV